MEIKSIITKGTYTQRQTESLIALKQYIIGQDDKGGKQLLLRFANERTEPCRAFAFVIYQIDAKGSVIAEERYESTEIQRHPHESFAYEEAIALQPQCTDFRIRLLYAKFGSYTYRVEDEGVLVSFEKKKAPKKERYAYRYVTFYADRKTYAPLILASVLALVAFAVSGFLLG